MLIPHKRGQYALRAIYELAKRMGEGPIKISDIASAQGIPRRFLEVILNQLKGSGIVKSKRGFYGGYALGQQYPELADCITVCATETKTEADLDTYADALALVLAEVKAA